MKNAGMSFARLAKALCATNSEVNSAAAFAAAQNWLDVAPIVNHLKGIIGGLTTEEMALSPVATDFSDAVRPLTVLGRLQGMRRVPHSVRVLTSVGVTNAAFIGQGKPIPVSKMDMDGDTLYRTKVSGISVISQELMNSSAPSADKLLSSDLAGSCAYAVDVAFLDPNNSGVTDEKPASITNGVTALTSTGTTFAQVDSDLTAMQQELIAAGSNMQNATWIVKPSSAVNLASLRDSSGAAAYPNVSVLGGSLKGLPVVVVGTLADDVGSPITTHIVLVDASQIVLADDGGAEIEVSRNGTLQMLDNPTNNSKTGTATNMVSLFQTQAVGFRGTRWINWKLRRPYVSVLSGVAY